MCSPRPPIPTPARCSSPTAPTVWSVARPRRSPMSEQLERVHVAELRGATVGYHARTPVLHDVTLAIGRGESVGIIGETGSGKTTLARTLLG
ncbi:MAG: ATP-binding cassette domain-containing protein, partial [Microbacterium sp.]